MIQIVATVYGNTLAAVVKKVLEHDYRATANFRGVNGACRISAILPQEEMSNALVYLTQLYRKTKDEEEGLSNDFLVSVYK